MAERRILIGPDGTVRSIYDDSLRSLMSEGDASISRASHVEPDPENPSLWMVDLSPVGGPKQGGFELREEALKWEVQWLNQNRLGMKTRP